MDGSRVQPACHLREPQAPRPHQPSHPTTVAPVQVTPGQYSLQLQPSHQNDTGTKLSRTTPDSHHSSSRQRARTSPVQSARTPQPTPHFSSSGPTRTPPARSATQHPSLYPCRFQLSSQDTFCMEHPRTPPACTRFNFGCPARKPSARTASGPPWPVPTSALVILPGQSQNEVPQNSQPTSATTPDSQQKSPGTYSLHRG